MIMYIDFKRSHKGLVDSLFEGNIPISQHLPGRSEENYDLSG
jgi:hypothetical protein